jgi:HlyD family secretion protein
MRAGIGLTVSFSLAVAACQQAESPSFPGSTEWDRNVVLAEASERVLEWFVEEGDAVAEGDLILTLDPSRYDARLKGLEAQLDEAGARLRELEAGPRIQTIERARADLESAEAAAVEAELQFDRATELVRRELTAQSNLDQTRATRDQRRAAVAASRAALDELLAGTRQEQIDQAVANVAAIKAAREELRLTRDRLDVRAPRSGRVDALPFKAGDQPRQGDVLVSLLVGPMPIARIFIAASARAQYAEGDPFSVEVEGVEDSFRARLRSVRSEASFTPYYALSGDDASRIVYRAELLFEDPAASELPAGLPLTALPLRTNAGND